MTFTPLARPHLARAGLAGLALLGLAACATQPTIVPPAPVAAAPPAPPAPAATPAPIASASARPVFFEPVSANLGDDAREALRELAERAVANPGARLMVVGYTSPRGTNEANVLLARLRARVVADALVENGVPAQRIRIVGRGPTAPAMADIESRRVEVRLDNAGR